MVIKQITFSPIGGTKRVADAVSKGIGTDIECIELCVPEAETSEICLSKDDFAVIAMPVYAGRVPALAIERLHHIKADNTPCAIIAVYGNRAYEDALVEMEDAVKEQGFVVKGAIAAIAEHSIFRQFGKGRPDADDAMQLVDFGKRIADTHTANPSIPGNRPYKDVHGSCSPIANENCKNCGKCASVCPVGAIDRIDCHRVETGICIGCMKCVSVCPSQARNLPQEHLTRIETMIREACLSRKNNELFI